MSITTSTPSSSIQNPTQSSVGNIQAEYMIQQALIPTAVGGNNVTEQPFTIIGLALGDAVQVSKPTTQLGLGIVGARVSAVNTLSIAFINATNVLILPTPNEMYLITVTRATTQSLANGLPASALTT